MKQIMASMLIGLLPLHAAVLWVEGETSTKHSMNRHPWWYDQVKKEAFSGGDFLSNFSEEKSAEASYTIKVEQAGQYEFWIRGNPIQSTLSAACNDDKFFKVDTKKDVREETNVAADGKPDLRFIAWIHAGKVTLRAGENVVKFRMDGKPQNHGYIDCFVLANEAFTPKGLLKPQEMAAAKEQAARAQSDWFAFEPAPEMAATAPMNLRSLNEAQAGDGGFISTMGDRFIHANSKKPVRFWAVNGPRHELTGEALRHSARMLASYGVNLVRVHGAMCDENGTFDPAKVAHAHEIVRAMKAEGIYTHFSIYFPLWLKPKANHPWLAGYNGKTHPFASLYFNQRFQQEYRTWWRALLTTPDAVTGKPLTAEPAVMGVEMVNEDSLFFWTFDAKNIPRPQMSLLEKRFGDWLTKRHGSIELALKAWGSARIATDAPSDGRVGFRPLWSMFNEKTPRDRETITFLYQVQSQFYQETRDDLRKLGFRGVITASNWITASPEILGPLEKLSYMSGDFIDRHGYFAGLHQGENAEWSMREGHTYSDRSALRFDAATPGEKKSFVHPVMDPEYGGKPSMISETTFCRPNRYRSEGPLFFAAYGALQDTDGIVHFAFDGDQWSVKPNFWMQPWTLASPAMMGQFPAAALIYRKGLIHPGAVVAEITLGEKDLYDLKGTPLPQDAALDELRAKDLPLNNASWKKDQRLDPLLHFVGRAQVRFGKESTAPILKDLSTLVQRQSRTVRSSHGELLLDYEKGLLTVNAAAAQGFCGNLKSVASCETKDAIFESPMDLGCVLLVALDDQPIAQSSRMLLQVMSEEQPSGFATRDLGKGLKQITSLGTDPWLVRNLSGTVTLKRSDAATLKVTALRSNGNKLLGNASQIMLEKNTLYYLIEK